MLTIFGRHDEKTQDQIHNVLNSGATHYVQCADGHLGYSHPIGGVAAYKDKISLSGVGFDIGCGCSLIRTDLTSGNILPHINDIMDLIYEKLSFGIGRKNNQEVETDFFDRPEWKLPLPSKLKELARSQFGTIGSGNHYVDIFVEHETDAVWIGVHFGSRGFGHKIATHFMSLAGAKDDMMSPPALLDANSKIGRDYWDCMTLAGHYAIYGRDWVLGYVARLMGAIPNYYVDNNHNLCWKENHFGEEFYVVRKGATPAFPGQKGFVGGSMGDDAVVIEGVDSSLSRDSLYSTVHGAGRVMSRSEAKGKTKKDKITGEVRVIKEPKVIRSEMEEWIAHKGVCRRGGDLDEAPQAYRRLDEVLRFHEGTIKILHRLSPVGVAMAGKEYDPYSD